MKKLLSLLLVVVMLFSVSTIAVFAEKIEKDEFFVKAVQKEHPYMTITADDIEIEYMYYLGSQVDVVKYYVKDLAYTADIAEITMGNYVVTSDRPEPVIYSGNQFYDLDVAYEYGIIGDKELELMCSLPYIDIKKVKVQPEVFYAAVNYKDDEFINVRFTLDGSEKDIFDFDGWDKFSDAAVMLKEFYDNLHQRFLDEVLKDFEYVDICHNSGISIIGIKKADIEKIAESEMVILMEYISPVHMKYIETYNPQFKDYVYKNELICYEKGEITYRLIKAYNTISSPMEVALRIGDVIMQNGAYYSNFRCQYGLYDVKEDKFYDLYDITDNYEKYCNIEALLLSYCDATPAGDSDGDSIRTIMDATKIQRCIAQLEDVYSIDIFVSDMDNDGEITIMDATAIQLKIAQLS